MAIKIFYFVAAMADDYLSVIAEQMDTIKSSGLYDECSQIYVCLADGKRKKVQAIIPPKARIAYASKVDQFEFPALHMVKEYTNPEDKILYLHAKGLSRGSGNRRTAGDHWRRYMDWGCIERYKDHLEALNTHDISGVQLTKLNAKFSRLCGASSVFAGNYWWANGTYIDTLDAPEIGKNRWLAEGWIFSGAHKPRANDLHNLTNGGLITDKNTFSLPTFSRLVYDPDYLPPFVVPDMMQSRIEVINMLIEKFGYKSYLEIGYFKGDCFKNIKCELKHSVDPAAHGVTYAMTSDAFFAKNERRYDIIFIDGLHAADQVKKDIDNSLEYLADGGTIVCHDAMPQTEQEAEPLDVFKGGYIWNGDVYKTFAKIRQSRPDLMTATLDLDWGLFIIRKSPDREQLTYRPEFDKITFKYYLQNRKKLLNVIEPEDARQWIEDLT